MRGSGFHPQDLDMSVGTQTLFGAALLITAKKRHHLKKPRRLDGGLFCFQIIFLPTASSGWHQRLLTVQ
jgi:hypothetical protein